MTSKSDHDHDHAAQMTTAPQFWEQRYLDLDEGWGRRPNAVLVDVLTELAPAPARVLDLGAGHGGDALWLASLGWTVTAVDISATALRRIDDALVEAGIAASVSTQQHDLTASFPEGEFDLVTATYFQSPVALDRPTVLRRAAAAIAPDGWMVVIGHASSPPWSEHGHSTFPSAEETFAELDLDARVWHPELCERRDREATGPGGETAWLTDNLMALRKAPGGG